MTPTAAPRPPGRWRAALARLWRDTLFKRLFLLMWAVLVAATLLGRYSIHIQLDGSGGPPPRGPGAAPMPGLPPMPSLPPLGGPGPFGGRAPGDGGPPAFPRGPRGTMPPQAVPDGASWPGAASSARFGGPAADGDDFSPRGPWMGAVSPRSGRSGREPPALWLDYLVRVLVIGLGAFVGARWLAAPMRRLAAAAQSLGASLGRGRLPAPLDEDAGTHEVRQTAQVFNAMARQLHAQFDERGLVMAALSHDLRTPMTRLRMRLEERAADDPALTRCIADLHDMDAMLDSVLDALRDERAPEPKRPLDVHALVQALADDLAETDARFVAVHGAPTVVPAAPAALKRVVANLLGNALRHAATVTAMVEATPAGGARIVVEDDGPGIPDDRIEAMFKPFVRMDASRGRDGGGVGLGLYIARDLTERQGGRLVLANRQKSGLRAEVRLPPR